MCDFSHKNQFENWIPNFFVKEIWNSKLLQQRNLEFQTFWVWKKLENVWNSKRFSKHVFDHTCNNSYILENAYDVTQDICKLMNIKPSKNYFDCGVQNYKFKFYQFAINCLKKAIDLDPKKKYIDYLYKVIEEKKNNGR